jgi:Zn-dependent M16 (insulinase) family peptidase
LGTSKQDAAEFDESIRLSTGGIAGYSFVAPWYSDSDSVQMGLVLTGQCLDRNIPKMYDLLSDLTLNVNFDNTAKLKTLINLVSCIIVHTRDYCVECLINDELSG